MTEQRVALLLCRVGARLCALPISDVVETMRPLPVLPLAGAPAVVRGVSIIRGDAVPVVDGSSLLGGPASTPARMVTVRVGHRQAALTVDTVLGVRRAAADAVRGFPPMLEGASPDVVDALAALDGEVLHVLQSARLVPEAVWELLDGEGSMS